MKPLTDDDQATLRAMARNPDMRPKVAELKALLSTSLAKVEAQRAWLTESLEKVDADLDACRGKLAFFDEVLSELAA